MARIRTIKPEFPHSESMGRVSRDARLLFIQLWTICDDSGRTRGNSRILASLLYPYDDDAAGLIDSWISELERENCIARYVVDGSTYLQVLTWNGHQKIDKPTPSKLPEFTSESRILANPPEEVSKPRGGIGREGKGREGSGEGTGASAPPTPQNGSAKTRKPAKTPIPEDFGLDPELEQYAIDRLPGVIPAELLESFRGKANAKGWLYANWRQAFQEFVRNSAPNSGHWAAGQYPKGGSEKPLFGGGFR